MIRTMTTMKLKLRTGLIATTLALAASAGGCGDGDEGVCNGSSAGGGLLEGSYCTNNELTWSEVRTFLQASGQGDFFSVEYIRPAGDGIEKTLVVLFDISLVVPTTNAEIRFVDLPGTSVRRITDVSQNLTDELDSERSSLTFTSPYTGVIGDQVEGTFVLFFTASQRALRGEFSGTLTDPAAGL